MAVRPCRALPQPFLLMHQAKSLFMLLLLTLSMQTVWSRPVARPDLATPTRQLPAGDATLTHYIEAARRYSPLAKDRLNQIAIDEAETERLKVQYTRSRIELNGDLLFVPIITTDGGHTGFQPYGTSAGKRSCNAKRASTSV